MVSAGLPASFEADKRALPWQRLTHIYCVNLDRRPERWSFMQDQFRLSRMPVRRWPAVDGTRIDVPKLVEVGLIAQKALSRYMIPTEYKLFGVDLTDGGIGCALSHMQIWKDIIECHGNKGDDACFLVLEDDCKFASSFSEEELFERVANVPRDWEIIFLGGQDLMRKQAALEVAPGVRRLYRGFRETTAYLITVDGCKACLEVCTPLSWQFDTHLTENEVETEDGLSYTVKPRGYCLFPPLANQAREMFKTDVQKTEHH